MTAQRDRQQTTDIAHVGISGTWPGLMSGRWKVGSRAVQDRGAAQQGGRLWGRVVQGWVAVRGTLVYELIRSKMGLAISMLGKRTDDSLLGLLRDVWATSQVR